MKTNFLCKVLSFLSLAAAVLCISGVISAVLMAIPVVVLTLMDIKGVPDSVVLISWIILFSLSAAGGVFTAWNYGRNKLVFEEKQSRGQSFLLWETPAFLLFFLLFYLAWLTDWDWPGLTGLVLLLIALIVSLVFPFRYCPNGFWKMIRGFGFFCAFSVFFWGSLILGYAGKAVAYKGNDPADFPKSVQWIGGKYIPEGAVNIKLEGRNTVCKWSCHVSEKDFLKFKAKSPFEFIRKEMPETHYFYENRSRNGGGITLRYDVKDERLTGSYSHH